MTVVRVWLEWKTTVTHFWYLRLERRVGITTSQCEHELPVDLTLYVRQRNEKELKEQCRRHVNCKIFGKLSIPPNHSPSMVHPAYFSDGAQRPRTTDADKNEKMQNANENENNAPSNFHSWTRLFLSLLRHPVRYPSS